MKKIVSTMAAAVILSSSAFAIELDTDSMYAGASFGLESIDPADSGITLVLMGAIPFKKDADLGSGTFAIETELTYSVTDSSYNTGFGSIDYSLLTLAAYSAYIYDVNEQFFIKPRIGLIYKSLDATFSGFGGVGSASEIGIALGVQAGYKINKQLDATLGLNLVDSTSITHLTAGIQYHF